jgi:predicted hydrocarbon binding protein
MHCHHYSINLQKTLEDTLGERGADLLFQAAEQATHKGFKAFFTKYRRMTAKSSQLEFASTLFQNCGLGVIHFQDMPPGGGLVVSTSSHYVTGWLAKIGRRRTPGCHFARGWIAGVMEAVYDRPYGSYRVEEKQCKMMCSNKCVFLVQETV